MVDSKAHVYATVYEANRRNNIGHDVSMKRAAEAVEHFSNTAFKNVELRGVSTPRPRA